MNLGFVGTRFHGHDGVTLETAKVARVLREAGYEDFYFAGMLEPQLRGTQVAEAFFGHPRVEALQKQAFGRAVRSSEWGSEFRALTELLKNELHRFLLEFEIDLLVTQNTLSIPMHLALGQAVTEVLAETGVPTLAHGHDFFWERQRFGVNAVRDILDAAFPPNLPSVRHLVINSIAQEQLSLRKGVSSVLVPNGMEFELEAPGLDDFNRDFRTAIGLSQQDILVLQPTRVIPRKGIELAIELCAGLADPRVKLVITHATGDEGWEYRQDLEHLAELWGVDLRFVDERMAPERSLESGEKKYALWDAYPHADFVTYPSLYEGFGNALLEAVWFRKPLLVNRYSVYDADIRSKGFRAVELEGRLSKEAVKAVAERLEHPERFQDELEINYQLCLRHFSMGVLRKRLETALSLL